MKSTTDKELGTLDKLVVVRHIHDAMLSDLNVSLIITPHFKATIRYIVKLLSKRQLTCKWTRRGWIIKSEGRQLVYVAMKQ